MVQAAIEKLKNEGKYPCQKWSETGKMHYASLRDCLIRFLERTRNPEHPAVASICDSVLKGDNIAKIFGVADNEDPDTPNWVPGMSPVFRNYNL